MEFIIMQERSAGNAEVGSMWTETAVFPETATLADVKAWLDGKSSHPSNDVLGSDGRVTIQIAQHPLTDEPEAEPF